MINKVKAQIEGTSNMSVLDYAKVVIEVIVYSIVGEDKFYKWLWLHDIFENWH